MIPSRICEQCGQEDHGSMGCEGTVKKIGRRVIFCEVCKKPKDLSAGRLLHRIVAKGSLRGSIILEDCAWICYECLPPNTEEWEE